MSEQEPSKREQSRGAPQPAAGGGVPSTWSQPGLTPLPFSLPTLRSEPEPGAAPPGAARTSVAGRLMRVLVGRIALFAILLTTSVACALLLTPDLFKQRLVLGDEVLGEFATGAVKANRDYTIPDNETTARKRAEASEAILPVYDYDTSVVELGVEHLREGFALMQREVAREEQRQRDSQEGPGDEARRRPPRRKELDVRQLEHWRGLFQPQREEWQRRTQVKIDDESFAALSDARFSEELRLSIEKLLVRANGQMMTDYRDPLVLSGVRGIAVRRVAGGNVLSERVVTDLAPIRDRDAVRGELEQLSASLFPDHSPAAVKAGVALASKLLRANLFFNREETEERRRVAGESVKPVLIQVRKGEKIIGDGERIEERHLLIFQAIRGQARSDERVVTRVAAGALAALLLGVAWLFARRSFPRFRPTRKETLFAALSLVAMLALINLSVTMGDALRLPLVSVAPEALYFAAPFAAGAVLMRIVFSAEMAFLFALCFSALVGIQVGLSLELALFSLVVSLVASLRAARVSDRAALFKAGFWAGLAGALLLVASNLYSGRLSGWDLVAAALASVAGCSIGVPTLVIFFSWTAEAAFGLTTDFKLLELANLNHPALKELIVQAPGTYHHSIVIGSLVESAAEVIGANPLLARVGAYYHDIGKGRNPLYFAENQRVDNRHDKLSPQTSAAVVKRHIADGIELARQYRLPRAVADMIPQHHGTRIVGYFYQKALREQELYGPVDEALFRYAGPKPQSREAALIMIGDAVEAAARSLQEPTPARLQALVQKIVNAIFSDGQLDECGLTLRDLNAIARSFVRTLGGIYHTRPEYPPQVLQPKAGQEPLQEGVLLKLSGDEP